MVLVVFLVLLFLDDVHDTSDQRLKKNFLCLILGIDSFQPEVDLKSLETCDTTVRTGLYSGAYAYLSPYRIKHNATEKK